MPVIRGPFDCDRRLDPGIQDSEAIRCPLGPYPDEVPAIHPVRRFLNRPQNEGPECVAPLAG